MNARCTHKRKQTKSQLSLEFMLVLAASASFLLALLPVYAQAQVKANEKITDQTQEIAFEAITAQAREAHSLGRNALLSAQVFLSARQTSFSFDSRTRELRMEYENGGKNKTLAEKTAFDAVVAGEVFGRGKHEVRISNQGALEITITPAGAQEK